MTLEQKIKIELVLCPEGLTAKEIAEKRNVEKGSVNRILYAKEGIIFEKYPNTFKWHLIQSDNKVKQIYDYLKERGVEYLIHFTVLDNLPGILNKGIVPRNKLNGEAIKLDSKRQDGVIDGSCFSLSFPNYKMFYKYRTDNENRVFVVLAMSVDFIKTLSVNQIAFYPANAAMVELRNTFSNHQGIDALREMFSEHPLGSADKYRRSQSSLPDSYTTNPQAEVIIKGVVPKEYICKIYVSSESDKRAVKAKIDRSFYDKIQVYSDFFDHRFDFSWW